MLSSVYKPAIWELVKRLLEVLNDQEDFIVTSLIELYEKNKDIMTRFRKEFSNYSLNGPIIMELDKYFNQDIKLFIIGQQTKGWCDDYDNFEALFKTYRDFNMGEKYKSTPFWDFARKIENIIGIDNYSCAYSNINRYDNNGEEPKDILLEKMKSLDFLLKEEIEIINPDICLFFINKKNDPRLQSLFPGVKFEAIDGLKFNDYAHIYHDLLPTKSFRFPHPAYIRRSGMENIFFTTMKEELS